MNQLLNIISGWWGPGQFIFLGVMLLFFAILVEIVVRGIARFFTRTLVVLIWGWPPAHLDADGDWKPKE